MHELRITAHKSCVQCLAGAASFANKINVLSCVILVLPAIHKTCIMICFIDMLQLSHFCLKVLSLQYQDFP